MISRAPHEAIAKSRCDPNSRAGAQCPVPNEAISESAGSGRIEFCERGHPIDPGTKRANRQCGAFLVNISRHIDVIHNSWNGLLGQDMLPHRRRRRFSLFHSIKALGPDRSRAASAFRALRPWLDLLPVIIQMRLRRASGSRPGGFPLLVRDTPRHFRPLPITLGSIMAVRCWRLRLSTRVPSFEVDEIGGRFRAVWFAKMQARLWKLVLARAGGSSPANITLPRIDGLHRRPGIGHVRPPVTAFIWRLIDPSQRTCPNRAASTDLSQSGRF
jgi:hypothetical protein